MSDSRIMASVVRRYRGVRAGKTRWIEPSLEKSYGSRSPLGDGYWVVQKPLKVWIPTGRQKPSHVWIGTGRALATEVEEIHLMAGDELHQLASGLFAVPAGGAGFKVHVDDLKLPAGAVREAGPDETSRVRYRPALGPEKVLSEGARSAAAPADGGEGKFLAQLKLDIARAKEAASDLWSVTSGAEARREREKVYWAISKLDDQIARWKATR